METDSKKAQNGNRCSREREIGSQAACYSPSREHATVGFIGAGQEARAAIAEHIEFREAC